MRLATQAGFGVGLCLVVATAGAQTEPAPVFRASNLLPSNVLSGPDFRVDERVQNDGFMNHYRINSRFGEMVASSDAMVRKRAREVAAIAKLEKLSRDEQFLNAVGNAGRQVLQGAANLITDPIDTVSGALTGVGALFRRGGDALFGDPKSDVEGGALAAISGKSAAKRDYAASLGVDVYSRNPILQSHLDAVAGASAAGSLSASVGLAFVGGGLGTAISVTKGTQVLNEIIRTTPPTDLRRMNREKLAAMDIHPDVVDLFLSNTVYTPRQQTLLVAALAEMSGVSGRGQFVRFAVLTKDADTAEFRTRQAQMYASFNRDVRPLKSIVAVGERAAGQTADGTMVFNVPLDYLAWTDRMAAYIDAIAQRGDMVRVAKKELWVAGTVSQLSRSSMEARGWKVTAGVGSRLIPPS
jgi:hypothetical protein